MKRLLCLLLLAGCADDTKPPPPNVTQVSRTVWQVDVPDSGVKCFVYREYLGEGVGGISCLRDEVAR